ncbi:hypothetical protein [Sulfuriroseicoccus oceanibius]|uniref:Uncharacterized protein n=1 Tax=Sulfuriroseicoccus oceanibius TaxID=2707525 RepID=A0A6B3L944_9BACT|nr:hypothetical protein [Sulfuriroseicoccus oceanibius]QQL44090.1 hypothetical protein G3M56_009305 [Sulfuriroseicoccus oceanibius]
MNSIKCLIICLSVIHQDYAQAVETSRPPATTYLEITVPSLTGEEIIDAVREDNDPKLLSSIGRGAARDGQMRFPLVWHEQVTLGNQSHTVCLFDSPFRVMPGHNPRVLVLIDHNQKIVTWNQFTCEPAFRYGLITQVASDTAPYLITINPSSRFGGEPWFERYKLETAKITKVSEGYDPRIINQAQQDGAANRDNAGCCSQDL